MPTDLTLHPPRIAAVTLPLMLVLFIATLDQTIVVTALGTIGAALGDRGTAPLIATAYLLTSAVTALIFGKLGDMHGRKPIFQCVATGALNFFKRFGGAVGAAVFGAILTAAMPAASTTDPAASLAAFHEVYGWAIPFVGLALLLAIVMEEGPLSEEAILIAEGQIDIPEY